MDSFGFTVKLISEALDVVKPISDDNTVSAKDAFNGRVFRGSSIFFGSSFFVHISIQTKSLIVDMGNAQSANMWLCRSVNLGLEEVQQLI